MIRLYHRMQLQREKDELKHTVDPWRIDSSKLVCALVKANLLLGIYSKVNSKKGKTKIFLMTDRIFF